jgi:hypothetical protein
MTHDDVKREGAQKFTAEEVRRATGADDKNDYEPDILIWAASEYLKAREVIAWYAAPENHNYQIGITTGFTNYEEDAGQRARDFLGGGE